MASYLHGAVTSDDWLVIVGGIGVTGDAVSQLSVYQYDCHQWTDLTRLHSRQSSSVLSQSVDVDVHQVPVYSSSEGAN